MVQPDPPRTLAEAIDCLLASLSSEEQHKLRSMKVDDLIDLHLSLGMVIRNRFSIWGNEPLLRSCARDLRPRIEAELEKALAKAWFWQRSAIRELFGRLLQRESVHPDDASAIIIREAWHRLQAKPAEGAGIRGT